MRASDLFWSEAPMAPNTTTHRVCQTRHQRLGSTTAQKQHQTTQPKQTHPTHKEGKEMTASPQYRYGKTQKKENKKPLWFRVLQSCDVCLRLGSRLCVCVSVCSVFVLVFICCDIVSGELLKNGVATRNVWISRARFWSRLLLK